MTVKSKLRPTATVPQKLVQRQSHLPGWRPSSSFHISVWRPSYSWLKAFIFLVEGLQHALVTSWPLLMEGHNSGFVTTLCSTLNTQHTITLTHTLRLCCHSEIVDGDSQRRTAKSAHWKSLCSQLSDLCHCHRHNDAQHHPGPNSRPPASRQPALIHQQPGKTTHRL